MKEFLKKPIHLKKKTVIWVVAALVVLVILSIMIPLGMDDGLKNYSGVEHEAAELALKRAHENEGRFQTYFLIRVE